MVTRASAATLSESLDQPAQVVTSTGNALWLDQAIATHDGVDAVKSGVISDGQTTSIQTTIAGPAAISFWWKASTEAGYDFFRFFIDDIEQPNPLSGEVDWQLRNYTVATSGEHTLRWTYSRDGTLGYGSNAAWVDELTISAAPTQLVTFDLGAHGTRSGGGELIQSVVVGAAALAPTIVSESGWAFLGWDATFGRITSALTVHAQYEPISSPAITGQAQTLGITANGNAVLQISATGGAITYQWYNGQSGDTSLPVSGAVGGLFVSPALVAPSFFWVRVSNVAGTADSASIACASPGSHASELRGMGDSRFGQLGADVLGSTPTPTLVAPSAVQIATKWNIGVYLRPDRSLWAFGNNASGQFVDNSYIARSTRVQIAEDVASFSSGDSYVLFIKTNGELWGLGANSHGQLGDGSTTLHDTPVLIASGVVAVSAGYYHSLFIKSDGSLWAMGGNDDGELGDASNIYRTTPVQVGSGVAAVSAGGAHSLFLKTDASLWAMGSNADGQLGDGSTTTRSSPVSIGSGVTSMAAGDSHSLFIKADGSLWGMGSNAFGQIGDNSATVRHSIPVLISATVRSVAAGENHSLFIKTNGQLWAMGANGYGQLGDGSTTERPSPVLIHSSAASAAAGGTHSLFLSPAPPVSHTVGFDLGARGTRSGGGALIQSVIGGSAAIAPEVTASADWVFTGWDASFANITTPLTVRARYLIAQSITFFALPAKIYGDPPFALSATATSGLSVSFTVVSGPATLSEDGLTLSLTGIGDVILRAAQAGNGSYAAATPVERTLTVAALSPFVIFLANANVPSDLRAPNADPDSDGIPNLLEYALDLAPMNADPSGLPKLTLAGSDLTFSYKQARADVAYSVQTTTDLTDSASWTTTGVVQGTADANGSVTATVLQDGLKRFLRLRVTLTP